MKVINRFSKRFAEDNPSNLNLIALLDVLVILLIFLLQYQKDIGQIYTVADDIKLPSTKSGEFVASEITVQVSPHQIWVNNKKITDSNIKGEDFISQDKKTILPLFYTLSKLPEHSVRINFIIDRSIKQGFVIKLLYTAHQVGFKDFNLLTKK